VIRACAPDLVLLQEATKPVVVARLAELTGLPAWGSSSKRSLAFLSRIEIQHHEWHRPPWSKRAFLEIVPKDHDCRVFGVHLSALHSNWTERRRTYELRALLASIVRHAHGRHVVAGDFNTLPFRLRPLVWMSGGDVRWRTVRHMLDAGYVDAYRSMHPADPGYTFPTWNPHVRLDYAFVPAALETRLRGCAVVTQITDTLRASDHFPLEFEIDVG
jgi:endonuclease/exonuclease/phosphatase family metal-dependent hydrolase